jgi:hypothetical protein
MTRRAHLLPIVSDCHSAIVAGRLASGKSADGVSGRLKEFLPTGRTHSTVGDAVGERYHGGTRDAGAPIPILGPHALPPAAKGGASNL